MSDSNAMTRILNGQRVPAIVVHKVTGERIQRAPIDCRELIAGGEWVWLSDLESKEVAPAADPTKAPDAAPVAEVEPAAAVESEPKSAGKRKGK